MSFHLHAENIQEIEKTAQWKADKRWRKKKRILLIAYGWLATAMPQVCLFSMPTKHSILYFGHFDLGFCYLQPRFLVNPNSRWLAFWSWLWLFHHISVNILCTHGFGYLGALENVLNNDWSWIKDQIREENCHPYSAF